MFHRQTLDVTFFDAFGVEFEQKMRLAKQQEVVVVICAAKISLYEGMWQLLQFYKCVLLTTTFSLTQEYLIWQTIQPHAYTTTLHIIVWKH